jgi:hypothetical protein
MTCGVGEWGEGGRDEIRGNWRKKKPCSMLYSIKSSVFWNITHVTPASFRFLAWLILWAGRRKWHVPPKRRLSFHGIHRFISHKIKLLITTGVGAASPACCSVSSEHIGHWCACSHCRVSSECFCPGSSRSFTLPAAPVTFLFSTFLAKSLLQASILKAGVR